ncbi:MAG: sulfatase [Bacteroidales bacterium]|nr:sulfatase [Bacteroidales bacterium]
MNVADINNPGIAVKNFINWESVIRTCKILPLLPGSCIMLSCDAEMKSSDNRPNVLLCIFDDASYQHMGAYGCTYSRTPAFDRVASDGLLFMKAYTPKSLSAPSRAVILTGRYPWQLEQASSQFSFFPSQHKTFTEALRDYGYVTGFTGKGWAPGDPGEIDGKPRLLIGESWQNKRIEPPAGGISRIDYSANFEDFLKEVDPDAPWFFWCGPHEPHRKYEYGSGVSKGGKDPADVDSVMSFWPDTIATRVDILDYVYEIEYADSHFLKCIQILEDQGKLDNTIVIITSDNGMPFPRVKSNAYEYSLHVPMAIMWHNGIKNPGRVIKEMIGFIDLAPTIFDVAGVRFDESGLKPFSGQSLTYILKDKEQKKNEVRNHLLLGQERQGNSRPNNEGYPIRGIITDDFLYLNNLKIDRWPAGNPEAGYMNCDGSPVKSLILNLYRQGKSRFYWDLAFGKRTSEEELYKVTEDKECMINLAEDSQYDELRKTLREVMLRELKEQNDPRVSGTGDVFDAYPFSQPYMNNLYEKYMDNRTDEDIVSWITITDIEDRNFYFGYKQEGQKR